MKLSTQEICARFQERVSNRATFTNYWRDIAEYVLPNESWFYQNKGAITKGTQKNLKIYDNTAEESLTKFSSMMESLLTPHGQKWHGLAFVEDKYNEDLEGKKWLEGITNTLFRMRYNANSGFQHQMETAYTSLGAYGTQSIFLDHVAGEGFRYRSQYMGDTYMESNHQGIIDTIYIRFELTPRQAVQKWGDKVPPEVMAKFKKNLKDMQEYIHVIMPGVDYYGKDVGVGKKIASVYVAIDSEHLIDEGTFRTMPFITSRFRVSPYEDYGRSPAMQALPAVKTLQAMERTDLRAGQMLVEPPLLARDDGWLSPGMTETALANGGTITGGLDNEGRPTLVPLNTGARVDINEMKMERKRQSIKDAFFVNLFEILLETPRMTATEFLGRAQEKGILLSPAMNRQQSELLGPMIKRELDMLKAMGLIPPRPSSIPDDVPFDVIYTSPMSRMQKAEEVVGMTRTIDETMKIAQFDQAVMDEIDGREYLRMFAEGNGASMKMFKAEEAVAEERAKREAQQQQMMQQEQAGTMAKASLDLAKADQARAGV